MTETQNAKRYDLEDRTLNFAKHTIEFINKLPKILTNVEISKQLVRSASSVGANYIEANESLSKKDFIMKIKYVAKKQKKVVIG
jgi:four helix bundle protein